MHWMAQVALSLVMVVSAGLLARSALHIERGGTFDPHGVALLRLRPRLMQYPPARSQAFVREVVRRLEAVLGVESVTFARGVSLLSQSCCIAYLPEKGKAAMRADYHAVAPRYFSTLRIPLLAGRDFAESDRAGFVSPSPSSIRTWPCGSIRAARWSGACRGGRQVPAGSRSRQGLLPAQRSRSAGSPQRRWLRHGSRRGVPRVSSPLRP